MFSVKDQSNLKHPVAHPKSDAAVSFNPKRKSIMENAIEQAAKTLLKTKVAEADTDEHKSWNDIVFENRNQAYGAYPLRRAYAGNVMVGLIFTALIVIFIICYSSIAAIFRSHEEVNLAVPRKLVYTELSAPPPIQLPKLQKVVKFVPPKIVKEQITEETPTIEEIKQNETAAVSTEGTTIVFEEPVEEVIVEDDDQLFTVVEQNPEFEGGYNAMLAFLQQNMKYPANARRMQLEGTVYVSFIVNKNGSISDVKVMRGIMAECDKEAVRVVQMMPPWKPGKQNGRNVNVRFTLPLKFRLN
jgi:periplasmic protein TonB